MRELSEEAGIDQCRVVRLVGVFSRPERDPRFHAVTVVVECAIAPPARSPVNPLEVTEVGLFTRDALPPDLAMGMRDMLAAALRQDEPVVE